MEKTINTVMIRKQDKGDRIKGRGLEGIVRTALLSVLSLCALVSLALAQQKISVKILRVKAPAELREASGGKWKAAHADTLLQEGNSLRTLKAGKSQLLFPNKVILLLKENSQINLTNLSADPKGSNRVKNVIGTLVFNVKEALTPGSSFEIETPNALAIVRGTIGKSTVFPDGTSIFDSIEGSYQVSAQGVTVTVEEDYRTTVKPGEPPSDPEPSPDAEQNRYDTQDSESFFDVFYELDGYHDWFARFHKSLSIDFTVFLRFYNEGDRIKMFYAYKGFVRQREDYIRERNRVKHLLKGLPDPAGESTRFEAIFRKIEKIFEDIERLLKTRFHNISTLLEDLSWLRDPYDILLDVQSDPSSGYGGAGTYEEAMTQEEVANGIGLITLQTIPPDGATLSFQSGAIQGFNLLPVPPELVRDIRFRIFDGRTSEPLFSTSVIGSGYDLDIFNFIRSVRNQNPSLIPGDIWEFKWFFEATQTRSTGEFVAYLQSSPKRFTIRGIPLPGTADLRLTLPISDVRINQVISVDIYGMISSGSDLNEIRAVVRYDPTRLQFQNGFKGGFFVGSTLSVGQGSIPGTISISGRVADGLPPITGGGTIAVLNFVALDAGPANGTPTIISFDRTQTSLWNSLSDQLLPIFNDLTIPQVLP